MNDRFCPQETGKHFQSFDSRPPIGTGFPDSSHPQVFVPTFLDLYECQDGVVGEALIGPNAGEGAKTEPLSRFSLHFHRTSLRIC